MSSFLCPLCGGETSVTDSRPAAVDRPGIRRRRRCAVCHNRFTTYEQAAGNGGAGNFTTQLDDLSKQAEALVAQSEALLRATAHLQYLSTAWREIEDGRQQFTTIKAEDWKP